VFPVCLRAPFELYAMVQSKLDLKIDKERSTIVKNFKRRLIFCSLWTASVLAYIPVARANIIEVQLDTLLNPGTSLTILGDNVISEHTFVEFGVDANNNDRAWYNSTSYITSAEGVGAAVAPGTLIGPSTTFPPAGVDSEGERVEQAPAIPS
jgi:hypothetical protein